MSRNLFIILLLMATGSFFVLSKEQGGTINRASAGFSSSSNIHKIEELSAPQLDAFNRDKTLFILPVGTLEEHGPHLPIGMDTFSVNFRVSRVSDWLISDARDTEQRL